MVRTTTNTLCGQLREYLNLTQQQLASYLGTSRERVADEEARRRALTSWPSTRLTYLQLLLPPDWLLEESAPAPVAATPVAIAPPPEPLSDRDQVYVRYHYLRCERAARQLRATLFDVPTARARITARHRALVAAFAAPPPAAQAFRAQVPDRDPDRTARWVALDDQLSTPPHSAERAHAVLRLHLLETEAATLAAWLAAP